MGKRGPLGNINGKSEIKTPAHRCLFQKVNQSREYEGRPSIGSTENLPNQSTLHLLLFAPSYPARLKITNSKQGRGTLKKNYSGISDLTFSLRGYRF
jgi:hypothetical protein